MNFEFELYIFFQLTTNVSFVGLFDIKRLSLVSFDLVQNRRDLIGIHLPVLDALFHYDHGSLVHAEQAHDHILSEHVVQRVVFGQIVDYDQIEANDGERQVLNDGRKNHRPDLGAERIVQEGLQMVRQARVAKLLGALQSLQILVVLVHSPPVLRSTCHYDRKAKLNRAQREENFKMIATS
jgi:hypothetical protein